MRIARRARRGDERRLPILGQVARVVHRRGPRRSAIAGGVHREDIEAGARQIRHPAVVLIRHVERDLSRSAGAVHEQDDAIGRRRFAQGRAGHHALADVDLRRLARLSPAPSTRSRRSDRSSAAAGRRRPPAERPFPVARARPILSAPIARKPDMATSCRRRIVTPNARLKTRRLGVPFYRQGWIWRRVVLGGAIRSPSQLIGAGQSILGRSGGTFVRRAQLT